MNSKDQYTETEAHRHFARSLNGEVWGLLEKDNRSAEEDDLLVHAAHASCLHWLKIGTGLHQQRGEWLIARVYSELGQAEEALRHASRCMELTEQHAELMEDFDRAYAYEALARATAVSGNRADSLRYQELAERAGSAIADQESRSYYEGDLNAGDWHGLR
jgi:tetratricopeptide (TPR) repeat protein